MKLLVEDVAVLESIVVDEINEASGKEEKSYYIKGKFSTMGEKNRNGRVYSESLWVENVNAYQSEIQNNTINTLGENEHPSRVEVDPMKAVIKIVELYTEGKYVMGKAKILNNNAPETNQLKALIDEGIQIGVSSRGVGRMKGHMVEAFKLRTYDVVKNPSDYAANLAGMRESIEADVMLTESGDYTIKSDIDDSINEKTYEIIGEAFEKIAYKKENLEKESKDSEIKAKYEEAFGKKTIDIEEAKNTWDDSYQACLDIMSAKSEMKKLGFDIKKNGENSIKFQHKNGVIGSLTFDPTNTKF